MQKYLIGILLVIVGVLQVAYRAQKSKIKELDNQYSLAVQNLKGQREQGNKVFKMTIEQLEYYGDSIARELDKTRKELKVKSKDIKTMHYTATEYKRADTIVMRDTIFASSDIAIDTIIGDKWCSVEIGMRYPSYMTVNPKFKSEKHIIVSTKKETVEPPKKFFLFRWFQKKHTVLKVNVAEKNPYASNEESEYIEILK